MARTLCLAGLAAAILSTGGCGMEARAARHVVGDPGRGAHLVDSEACGSCHIVPGHASGDGVVGPPLSGLAGRSLIAGVLPNTPDNLALWLEKPQAVVPGNGMPNMGLTPRQAQDIAAYLYTLP